MDAAHVMIGLCHNIKSYYGVGGCYSEGLLASSGHYNTIVDATHIMIGLCHNIKSYYGVGGCYSEGLSISIKWTL